MALASYTDRLQRTITEAYRFIEAAEAARKRVEADGYITGTRETGAARRASMDLTRSLADLRRSSYS